MNHPKRQCSACKIKFVSGFYFVCVENYKYMFFCEKCFNKYFLNTYCFNTDEFNKKCSICKHEDLKITIFKLGKRGYFERCKDGKAFVITYCDKCSELFGVYEALDFLGF